MADDDDTEDQEDLQSPPQQVAVAERPDEHDYDTTQVEPSKKDEWADFRVQQQQPEQQAPQPQAAKDEWAEFRTQPEQKPEAESPLRSFLRNVAHQALPALASVPGAEAGAAAGGALGTAIAPGVGTVVGGLAGGLLGAGLAGGVTSYAQESAAKAIGMDDSQQRAINAAVNPTTELISNVAPMALIGGPGRVATTLGGEALRRGAMGALGAATEVGQEVIGGEKVDPAKAAAQFVGGAAFAKPYGWTERLGTRLGARLPLGEPTGAGVARPGFPSEEAKAPVDQQVEKPNPAAVPSMGIAREAAPPDTGEPPVTGEPQNKATLAGDRTESEGARAGPEDYGKTPTTTAVANVAEGPGQEVAAALQAKFKPEEAPAQAQQRQAPAAAAAPAVEPQPAPTPPPQGLPQDPRALRALAASVRRDGNERLARVYEDAADTTEAAQRRRIPEPTQQQQIQPQEEQRAPPVQQAQQIQPGGGPVIGPPPSGRGPAGAPPTPPPAQPALQPATRSDLQEGALAALRRQFMPMLSESAQRAGTALQRAYGPLARLKEQTATRFTNDLHQLANRMDRPAFERFVDAYEAGKVSTLPKDQQELAKVLGQNYSDFWKQIEKLPGADKMEATKDFLTHMYDNTNGQVDNFASNWYGASGGSLRARTHPTFADARAAGLQPLSNNPIEHFSRYAEGISHYLAQRQMMADLESQGRVGYFAPKAVGASGTPQALVRGNAPDGYAKIEVPWAGKQRGPVRLDAYAPRDIASTINQFYDAGLRRANTKNIYDFARQTKNAWTALELGLSAYHATTVGTESIASGVARALQNASRGDFAGATKELLKAPVEPITSYLYGRTGRQIYRDPTGTLGTPIQRQIMDVLTKANIQPGNLRATRDYDMSQLGNLWDAYKRGSLPNEIHNQIKEINDSYGLKLPKVLLDNTRRAMQTISKPLFEHYIPELKLGTMMKDMEAWYRANPKATDEEALAYARRVSNSIDNRMGEMNYNNLFMNKTAKDAAMLALRSFGFTVGGPFREIGAGLGSGAKAIYKGQNPLADPRTAYALAFAPTIAAIGATYQYLRTGEPPQDWRDLVAPRTGGTVTSVGQQVPERILVPGYMKDFLGYFVNPRGPSEELHAKLAAPWTAIMGQFTGKDWRDKPYVPPRATTLEWLQAHAQALTSHLAPISAKQLAEGKKEGSKLTLPEQIIGVRTPGAYLQNPKGLEAFMTKQQQRDWRTQEVQENRKRIARGLEPLPPRQLPASGYQ